MSVSLARVLDTATSEPAPAFAPRIPLGSPDHLPYLDESAIVTYLEGRGYEVIQFALALGMTLDQWTAIATTGGATITAYEHEEQSVVLAGDGWVLTVEGCGRTADADLTFADGYEVACSADDEADIRDLIGTANRLAGAMLDLNTYAR